MFLGEVVLKLHNLWVLEVFLTEKEVADIKECRANLLERNTVRHTLNDATSRRMESTRSPRPYGTWRRNKTPSFRTGIVSTSEQISEHGSGRNSLTSPSWVIKRKTIEAVPTPVEGYHIETEPQKAVTTEALPEEQDKLNDNFHNDKVDGEVEVSTSTEITKQTSKSSVDSYHTPPMVTSPKHPLTAVPALEDIEDVTPEEQINEVLSSVDTPQAGRISSTSTLVKSAEIPTQDTLNNLDVQPPKLCTSSSSSNNSVDDGNLDQLQRPEDSISLVTAEDSQQSHYGSIDEDKSTGLPEEISKIKIGGQVKENMIHENGWVSMENGSEDLINKVEVDTPKKREFLVKNKRNLQELDNSWSINDDNSDILLPDGFSPTDITSSNITLPKPLGELIDHTTLHGNVKIANAMVDSGNGDDAGISPTLSSVSCSDGHSSCRSSNLYTPQTASSEVQDNEVCNFHDIHKITK